MTFTALLHRFLKIALHSDEVLKIIKSLRSDFSTAYDNIPIFLIKPVVEYISSPLAFIINNQILTRMFSKKWEISRICPIPKVNKAEIPADYRRISVLPILPKVYELYSKVYGLYDTERTIRH